MFDNRSNCVLFSNCSVCGFYGEMTYISILDCYVCENCQDDGTKDLENEMEFGCYDEIDDRFHQEIDVEDLIL